MKNETENKTTRQYPDFVFQEGTNAVLLWSPFDTLTRPDSGKFVLLDVDAESETATLTTTEDANILETIARKTYGTGKRVGYVRPSNGKIYSTIKPDFMTNATLIIEGGEWSKQIKFWGGDLTFEYRKSPIRCCYIAEQKYADYLVLWASFSRPFLRGELLEYAQQLATEAEAQELAEAA